MVEPMFNAAHPEEGSYAVGCSVSLQKFLGDQQKTEARSGMPVSHAALLAIAGGGR